MEIDGEWGLMSEPTLLMKNYVIAQWGDILTISIFYRVVVPLNNAYHQNRPTKNDRLFNVHTFIPISAV